MFFEYNDDYKIFYQCGCEAEINFLFRFGPKYKKTLTKICDYHSKKSCKPPCYISIKRAIQEEAEILALLASVNSAKK